MAARNESADLLYRVMLEAHTAHHRSITHDHKLYLWGLARELTSRMRMTTRHVVTEGPSRRIVAGPTGSPWEIENALKLHKEGVEYRVMESGLLPLDDVER